MTIRTGFVAVLLLCVVTVPAPAIDGPTQDDVRFAFQGGLGQQQGSNVAGAVVRFRKAAKLVLRFLQL